MSFREFLFHLSEMAVLVDFTREKNLFFTGFAHRKSALWKTCELYLASHPQFQFPLPQKCLRRATVRRFYFPLSWHDAFLLLNRFSIHSYCSGRRLEFLPAGMPVIPCLGIEIVPVLATLLIP